MDLITFSYTDPNSGVLSALSLLDIIFSFIWILLVLLLLYLYKNSRQDPEYKYFIPFFLFKTATLFAFVFLYVYNYGGGDSTAFWSTANALVDLSTNNFPAFLNEFFGSRYDEGYINELIRNNIKYPNWIVRENEGYFTSKATWIFTFISGKNYLMTSLYFMFFSFLSQWRLFLIIKRNFIIKKDSKIHLFFLFIPSVSFWCTGISKDTIVLISILSIVYYTIKWLILKEHKVKYLLWIVFFSFLLMKIREITFVIIVISFFIAYLLTLVNKIKQLLTKILLRFALILFGFGIILIGFYFFGLNEFINNYLNEASIIQQDFEVNTTYTGKKYDVGISDFSLTGMIFASPIAILTGIFRPLLWESLSTTLLLNGLESTFLIYVFIKNVLFQGREFSKLAFNNWILLFSIVFVLLFSFITGLTAVIFGVLVRLRAPLLVFLAIVLYWKDLNLVPIESTEKQSEKKYFSQNDNSR